MAGVKKTEPIKSKIEGNTISIDRLDMKIDQLADSMAGLTEVVEKQQSQIQTNAREADKKIAQIKDIQGQSNKVSWGFVLGVISSVFAGATLFLFIAQLAFASEKAIVEAKLKERDRVTDEKEKNTMQTIKLLNEKFEEAAQRDAQALNYRQDFMFKETDQTGYVRGRLEGIDEKLEMIREIQRGKAEKAE